jgi:hypothetical protein
MYCQSSAGNTEMKLFSIVVSIAVLSANTVALAAPFDGAWIVRVETHSGVCPKTGMLPIQVNDGRVQSSDSTVLVSGKVAETGAINVVVGKGIKRANGSGRLSSDGGSGTWRGDLCAGSWAAERG